MFLDSDVVAWSLAWKLSMAGRPGNSEKKEIGVVNIYVVDDSGKPNYIEHNESDGGFQSNGLRIEIP